MKKKISIILSGLLVLSILGGCSSTYMEKSSATSGMTVGNKNTNYFDFGGIDEAESNDMLFAPEAPGDFIPGDTDTDTDIMVIQGLVEQKKAYMASVEMQTKDIDTAMKAIYDKIKETNGYIENESRYNWNSYDNYRGNRYADIILRVPSDNFDGFLNSIENDNLIVTSLSRNVVDYSTTYYDKESRINSLRTREERLIELLAQADNVTVMLEIESNLADVRYEIESLTRDLKTIDSKVDYSTITIHLYEVVRYASTETPKTFSERVALAFSEAIENFKEDFGDFVVDTVYDWPYILTNIAILLALALVIKSIVKKSKKKKKVKSETVIVDKSSENTENKD